MVLYFFPTYDIARSIQQQELGTTMAQPMWQSWLFKYLAAVGALSTTVGLYRLSKFLYVHLRSSSLSRYHHPNAWALVTGASDGIGLRFAEQLASHGFNVALHGRNLDKQSDHGLDGNDWLLFVLTLWIYSLR